MKPDFWSRLEDFFHTDRARIAAWAQVAAAAIWLVAFGLETRQIYRSAARLRWTIDRMEADFRAAGQGAREIISLTREMRSFSSDFELFRRLLNILPQEPGYLRTQKAISEEVGALRRKLGSRLKGRLHILVDTKTNKLYLKNGLTLLWQADCSVGRGGLLTDKRTGQRWEFVTPRGEFRVLGKIANPVWTKPDWAYVESKEDIPPPEDPSRRVEGELGTYVLNLGDGYLIHGTKDEKVLGRAVSHGCVRLGAENLEKLYKTVPPGTRVYIY